MRTPADWRRSLKMGARLPRITTLASTHFWLQSSGNPGVTATKLPPTAATLSNRRPPFVCPDRTDRKSTRLNSSHLVISYAVFSLKKKNVDVEEFALCLSDLLVHVHVHTMCGR